MAEIIEFGRKALDVKSVNDADLRQRKIEALRRIFQCTRCMLKCAKCGTQVESDEQKSSKYAIPYIFCKNCREEYEEYRARVGHKKISLKYYWHNDGWLKVWQTWLEHQNCLEQYRESKEFLQLLQEVEDLLKNQPTSES